jgi:hypothetical protein
MARQSKKIALKDGFYIEIKSNASNHQSPILVRRNTKSEVDLAIRQYSKTKNVRFYGEVKNQKIVAS